MKEKLKCLTGGTFLYAPFTFSSTTSVYVHTCVCVRVCMPVRACVCVFVCLGDSTVCSAQYLVTSSHGALGLLALKKKKHTHKLVYTQAQIQTEIKMCFNCSCAASVHVCQCE